MGLPFATAADLHTARERYAREAVPGVVQTPRYRLRYVTLGPPDGKPLLFVHGMADRALSFCLLMTRLADAGFRCVAFELANGKDDGANLGNYKHPHFTADVVCLLDHLGVARTDIFGSSFGSTITLRSLIEQPGRFRRAVVQGGFARRPLIPIERGLARLARYWPVRMAALPFREQAMAKLELPQFAHADPALYRFLVENSGWTPCRAAARRSLLIDRLDLRPALPHIRQPLLMIGGDADLIVPRHFEAEVEAGVPDVRRIEYAGCGHYPQYVLPAPTAAAVADFLS